MGAMLDGSTAVDGIRLIALVGIGAGALTVSRWISYRFLRCGRRYDR